MALTARIANRDDLISYIKRRLGEPVVRIEVTDDQFEDVVDDVFQRFVEVAGDGCSLKFMTLDTTPNTNEYQLAYDTMSVVKLYDSSNVYDLVAPYPDHAMADIYGAAILMKGFKEGGLLDFEIAREYIATLDFMLNTQLTFSFNALSKKLHILSTPEIQKIGILYYRTLDYQVDNGNIYDHRWIKAYGVALARRQWGENITKYSGTILPTGVTLNAEAMIVSANTEIEKLELELEERYEGAYGIFIG